MSQTRRRGPTTSFYVVSTVLPTFIISVYCIFRSQSAFSSLLYQTGSALPPIIGARVPTEYNAQQQKQQKQHKIQYLTKHDRRIRQGYQNSEQFQIYRQYNVDSTFSSNSGITASRHNSTVLDFTQNLPNIHDYITASDPVTSTDNQQHQQDTTDTTNDESGTRPLNVVLFYADDWTMRVLGKLNKQVMTPNIDYMADNGILFDHNCVTTSICWISRATLSTGVYLAVHRQTHIGSTSIFNETVNWLDTLFPLLRQHNYYTGLVGKWHAPSPRAFMSQAFDFMRSYYGAHWMSRRDEPRHVTDLNGEDALEFLRQRPRDKQFALQVSFFATHAVDGQYPSYQPMNESMSLYVDDYITPVETNTEYHFAKLPWFLDYRNEGRRRWVKRYDTADEYQKSMKDMYRMATEVDAVCGAVMEELKQQGVYNDTIFVFTTDNGNLHGEHGLSEKWFAFDQSIQVPLVIMDPRMPDKVKGTTNSEYTLSIDLAPTLLSAANVPVPDYMQGRDIAELYLQKSNDVDGDINNQIATNWRKDFFYEWSQGDIHDAKGHNNNNIPAVFALVRKDYKYVYWPVEKYEQLFHMPSDPQEVDDMLHGHDMNATTTLEALHLMRARYKFLKEWSQSGNPV